MTDTTNPLDPAIQNERQRAIDQAYAESGRTNGIYTGLMTTPEPAPVPEATANEEVVPAETITIPRTAFEDLCEWIGSGCDLDWWHENDDHHEADPETWALAQRVAEHLRLGYTVSPASEEVAAQ